MVLLCKMVADHLFAADLYPLIRVTGAFTNGGSVSTVDLHHGQIKVGSFVRAPRSWLRLIGG